jgi:hypothetical protein
VGKREGVRCETNREKRNGVEDRGEILGKKRIIGWIDSRKNIGKRSGEGRREGRGRRARGKKRGGKGRWGEGGGELIQTVLVAWGKTP